MASAPTSVELSPAPTLVAETQLKAKPAVEFESLASARPLRKYLLLAFFCLGQFLDTLNNSAILPALPAVTHSVGLTESDSLWLLAAYQATFASFLLIVSPIYLSLKPKLTSMPTRADAFLTYTAQNRLSLLAPRFSELSLSEEVLSTIASC
jgi:hypothetical protein